MKLVRAAVSLAVVGALALTACGRDNGGDEGGSAQPTAGAAIDDSPATGDITVWAMGEEAENLPDFVEAFTADNPDATIEVTAIPWGDVATKVQTAVAAGTVPDAIMIGSSLMPMVVSTGGLAPVPDGLVDPDGFFEGASDSTIAEGTTYGVPWYVETRVLYYRSDLAEDAGLSAPTTWEEMTSFAQGMKDGGADYGVQLPVGAAESATQVLMPFYAQAGGEVLNEAGDAYAIDPDIMATALDYYASFFTDGLAPLSGYGDEQTNAFANGSNPSFISGPWMTTVLGDQESPDWVEENVATAVIPAGSASNASYIGGAHWGVFNDANNADGAWKLIRWLSQVETQQAFYDATGDLPAVQAAWEYEPLQSNERVTVLSEQLTSTVAPPTVPSWEELDSFISNESEKVANGTSSAQDSAAAIVAKAEELGTGW